MNTGDIILVGLREYQDEKADVIQKFMADEARSLKAYGELPESIRVNETDTFGTPCLLLFHRASLRLPIHEGHHLLYQRI